jgi:hypothetical protein
MQDLNRTAYVSSRYGSLDVERMSVVHARRALDALEREHGPEVRTTVLGRALEARATDPEPVVYVETYRHAPATPTPLLHPPRPQPVRIGQPSPQPQRRRRSLLVALVGLGFPLVTLVRRRS